MTTRDRGFIGLLLLGMLGGGGMALMHAGSYGLLLFVAVPSLLGALAAWMFQPETGAQAVGVGAAAGVFPLVFLLSFGVEGLGCLILSVPLVVPLSILGSWFVYEAGEGGRARRGATMLLLIPTGLFFDATATPPVYEVRTSIVINAAPERVWQHVVTFSALPEPREWYFRTGLAYPRRAHIVGSGPGAVRYCEFSTGPFVEPIDVWDAPRLLRFRVTESPAPMHEWSPYGRVVPKHLHGYLVSERGQFLLTPLPGNRTLLEGATWYRHGLYPAPYWRFWSDAIIHRIHQRVLSHIKSEAEQPW